MSLNIALCYESVLPERGGCETYIADLSRRLAADGHEVHLYASSWDPAALPPSMVYHPLPLLGGPRWLRPRRFAAACLRALQSNRHDVTVGFDKTWGQDVLYPQGGLHAASAAHNIRKYRQPALRFLARLGKALDPAHWSFRALERRQYLGPFSVSSSEDGAGESQRRRPTALLAALHLPRIFPVGQNFVPRGRRSPLIVVNSEMVRHHFYHYYRVPAEDLRVVRSAIDPGRFADIDRPRRRQEWREQWGILPEEPVALFVAMNYRLKGLEPLLHAVACLPPSSPFRLLVVGNPRTGRYEHLARKLGIEARITFLGPRRDVQNCYFAADFLVHSTFYDPCSLVVLEALACGLPIITSRFNGASELLHPPQEGYVVDDPHDHEALAHCMIHLLDPARRAACAQACRRTAAEWTFERHYQQLLEVFTQAAAKKRAA
jgi:UDP-glucose:(heptosyl)LPS alpha-1,3-glucosyltransferase